MGRPVEHLGEVASLEGDDAENDQADGQKLVVKKIYGEC